MSADIWTAVASTSDVVAGAVIGTEAGGEAIAIYNVEGCYYATSNICTHEHVHLSDGYLDGKLIECPLHAGTFDVTTGKGMGPPIMCDIRTFPVRVVAEAIEVCVNPDRSKA